MTFATMPSREELAVSESNEEEAAPVELAGTAEGAEHDVEPQSLSPG
jgi:hypothetical protein